MRAAGKTYREIGEALRISKGGAHALVRKAEAECRRKAEMIPRGPSSDRPRGAERARELLRRLRDEYGLVEDQALDHLDGEALRPHRVTFDDAVEELDRLIDTKGRKVGLAPAAEQLVGNFHSVLTLAAHACRPFAQVGVTRNADTFAADALALVSLISPRAKVVLPTWSGAELMLDHASLETPLDPDERRTRDLQIVLACLRGDATQREIAAEHGITDRQLRRIWSSWRTSMPSERLDVAALEAALEDRTRRLLGDLDSSTFLSKRSREEIGSLFQLASSTSSGGKTLRSPVDPSVVRELALALREKMDEAGVSLALVEDLTALVVGHLVPSEV